MVLCFYDECSQATFLGALNKVVSLVLHSDVPSVVIHLDMRLLLNHFGQMVTTIRAHHSLSFARVHSHFFALSCYEFLINNHIFPVALFSEYDENH
ncbi:hypothetical protein KC711_03155, partial [Candidatus Peregrinibacteria bacterium]|nr:hypothetical protein [Candidatus Peregrinibacteria bacterium]